MLEAFPATKTTAWGYEYFWTYFYAGGAYQAYFIGNARANYQIVMIGQPGVLPARSRLAKHAGAPGTPRERRP